MKANLLAKSVYLTLVVIVTVVVGGCVPIPVMDYVGAKPRDFEVGKTTKADIAKGADVNEKDKHGDTPLDLATQGHHKELVALFKQHGAKE